jgi:hypothetical protein
MVFHVLNRAVGRRTLFSNEGDYPAGPERIGGNTPNSTHAELRLTV